MNILKRQISELVENSPADPREIERIRQLPVLSPFSKEVQLLFYLLHIGVIDYFGIQVMYENYLARNRNLALFDMAPRIFGQKWAESHICRICQELRPATKQSLAERYPGFNGEFDLWLRDIRIEVKACRANDAESSSSSLAARAYCHEEARFHRFQYHYQQLKPSCCDVFIWIGVCRDEFLYWIITNEELRNSGKLRPQHRHENTGIAGAEIFEGQVFMTEEELEPYRVQEADVLTTILAKTCGTHC